MRLVRKVEADDPNDIPIPHPEVFAAMKMRHTLLIDDGRVRLRLLSVKDYYADAIVVVGGEIKDRKGVNLPDTLLPVSAMTAEGTAPISMPRCISVWTGSRYPSCSGRTTWPN